MKIAVFLDGRPGHEKQSRGIIAALRRSVPVDVAEIILEPTTLLQDIGRYAGYFLGFSGKCPDTAGGCDLLLGTGSRTHLPMLLCKKEFSAPAVTCMSPDFLLRAQFDLCCVPLHDQVKESSNIFLTIGPPNLSLSGASQRIENQGLILIGGEDQKSHVWDSLHIVSCLEQILCHDKENFWYISSSPRTPKAMLPGLLQLTKKYSSCSFVDYRDCPPGWVEKKYQESSQVWVTADSMSMIYEALTAGCRVGVIPVQWINLRNKFQQSQDYLCQHHYITPYSVWLKDRNLIHPPAPLDEANRCAQEILRRWYRKN